MQILRYLRKDSSVEYLFFINIIQLFIRQKQEAFLSITFTIPNGMYYLEAENRKKVPGSNK